MDTTFNFEWIRAKLTYSKKWKCDQVKKTLKRITLAFVRTIFFFVRQMGLTWSCAKALHPKRDLGGGLCAIRGDLDSRNSRAIAE